MPSRSMPRALALLPLLAGCYRYAPMDLSAVDPGESVRLRVAAATAQQLEPLLGRTDARVLSGVIIANGGDTLIVEVPTTAQVVSGGTVQTLRQRVSVPRGAILELESRELDRFKTTAVAAGAGLVIGAFVLRATVLDPGKDPLPGGGGAELRVPLFSWPR